MDIKDFINASVEGNAVQAQQALTDMLSAKAMDALATRKTEIAQSLYNGKEVQVASEEQPAEEV